MDKSFSMCIIIVSDIVKLILTGGTNFGFMNGANGNREIYQPTVTSYGKLIMQVWTRMVFNFFLRFRVATMKRQCGLVIRELPLRSRDPWFKNNSGHSLNLILAVLGSTSQLHL